MQPGETFYFLHDQNPYGATYTACYVLLTVVDGMMEHDDRAILWSVGDVMPWGLFELVEEECE